MQERPWLKGMLMGRGKIPRWVKLPYTAFLAVLVPFYWRSYGPVNFLWFCDIALLVTLPALWLESPFLSSVEAVAIAFPQLCWAVDFTAHLAGIHLLGLADYMFEPRIPLFARGLSLFHGWLPFLLLWMVWYQGYDRRAFLPQLVLTWAVLVVCFLFTPPPPGPPGDANAVFNVNYVFAFPWNEAAPQAVMPALAYLLLLMAFFAVCILLPTHFLLAALFPRRQPADIRVGLTNVSLPAAPPGRTGPHAAGGAETRVKGPEGTT